MTTHLLTDSATMFRRALLHLRRYPSLTILVVAVPVIFLLLFVFVLGDTLGRGLGAVSASDGTGRAAYLLFVVPGVLALALSGAAQGTAILIAMDLTQGIVARFRTMPVARSALLTGHVLGSLVQSAICTSVVIGIALLLGYRPAAGVRGWLVAVGVMAAAAVALTWLSLLLGLVAKSVETASNTPMILTILPFLGSGFVPTDSMAPGLRWFAEYQPFTPVINAIRGALSDHLVGRDLALALTWCALITVVSATAAVRRYNTKPTVG